MTAGPGGADQKVTSKYYPPDFDPNAISKEKKPKKDSSKLPVVRLAAPFSMKCLKCGEYIYKGRKFNARKEILNEKYLGTTLHRFYIKCTQCPAEITFRTDPKNNDYSLETGARRNFEMWRDNAEDKFQEETQEETLDRLERERGEETERLERDKMAELEDKMQDSKREMQIADALDEIRTRNARIERNEAAEKPVAATTAAVIEDEAARLAREEAEFNEYAHNEWVKSKEKHNEELIKSGLWYRDEEGHMVKRLSPEEEALLNKNPEDEFDAEEDKKYWEELEQRRKENVRKRKERREALKNPFQAFKKARH